MAASSYLRNFPFMLDNFWRDEVRWQVVCCKVLSFDVVGRYDVMFDPLTLLATRGAPAAPVARVPGEVSAAEPLLSCARVEAAPGAADDRAPCGTRGRARRVSSAPGPAASPPVGADAPAPPSAVHAGDTGAPGAAAPSVASSPGGASGALSPRVVVASAAGGAPSTAPVVSWSDSAPAGGAGNPASAEGALGAAAGGTGATAATPRVAISTRPFHLATGASATRASDGHGVAILAPATAATSSASTSRILLLSPTAPWDYTPISTDLQCRFKRALDTGFVQGGPADRETVEWSILERSAPTQFIMTCAFASKLELESRSRFRPRGSFRSSHLITMEFPAKGPTEGDAADLD